jgi:heme exporter protein D
MNWGSAAEFFAMGGKGFYVWSAYGATLAWMLYDAWSAAARRRRAAQDSKQMPNHET